MDCVWAVCGLAVCRLAVCTGSVWTVYGLAVCGLAVCGLAVCTGCVRAGCVRAGCVWTGFGDLLSQPPSFSYCERSGPGPVGVVVPFCFLALCLLLVLCPDKVRMVLLGTGMVGFLKILLVTSSLGEQRHEMF